MKRILATLTFGIVLAAGVMGSLDSRQVEVSNVVQPEPVVAAEQIAEPAKKPAKKLTWKDNPNKCNLKKQYIRADNLKCVNKSKEQATASNSPTGGGSCAAEIRKYPWPQSIAHAVMMQESGNNPSNHNYNPDTGDDSWGCFQINLYGANKYSRPSSAWLVIAANNVRYAYDMWRSQSGFCSTGGWYNTCTKLGLH